MNEYTAWDLFSAPLYLAREENDETIAQRQEEALIRRGHGSRRRRNMLRHDGPHRRYPRYDEIARDNDSRRMDRYLKADLATEVSSALQPAVPVDEDIGCGVAEGYTSGIYPYFSTEQREEEKISCYDNDWDEAYDADFWRTPGVY